MKNSNSLIFSLSDSFDLAKRIVKNLGFELSPIKISTFSDGEIFVKPLSSVRNKKVFIVQSLSKPVNENLMTLLIAIDAFKRAAPQEINIIIPYYCYSRQDRKTHGREPITAKLIADLLTISGANRIILVEIHSHQIQGFFNIPIDHVDTIYPIALHFLENNLTDNLCVVSPDYGGIKRARILATLLNKSLVIIDKRRQHHNVSESLNVLGDVKGKDCLIVDDMIDTAGTILNGAKILKKNGAKSISIVATHGLFNKDAFANLQKSYQEKVIEKVYVTDTIQIENNYSFLEIISISKFLSEILKIYIYGEGSVSNVYENYNKKIESFLIEKSF